MRYTHPRGTGTTSVFTSRLANARRRRAHAILGDHVVSARMFAHYLADVAGPCRLLLPRRRQQHHGKRRRVCRFYDELEVQLTEDLTAGFSCTTGTKREKQSKAMDSRHKHSLIKQTGCLNDTHPLGLNVKMCEGSVKKYST